MQHALYAKKRLTLYDSVWHQVTSDLQAQNGRAKVKLEHEHASAVGTVKKNSAQENVNILGHFSGHKTRKHTEKVPSMTPKNTVVTRNQ